MMQYYEYYAFPIMEVGQMMKKQLAVLCMVILTLTACAFPSADVEEPSETIAGEEESEEEKPKAEESKAEEEPVTAQELYETFVNQEYAGLENYACVVYDADGDGCRELYIKRGSSQSFYMVTYVNGGLLIEYQKEISRVVRRQQWIDMETLTSAQDEEMVHSGIYVYAEQDDKSENFWYPTENDFVAANGFEGVEPFFEYSIPDGTKRLSLYYDEATQKGCGIRYYQRDPSTFTTAGMYGIVFEGVRESGGSGILEDYLEPLACNGKSGSDYASDCTENMEYDAGGRLTHYDVSGLSYLKDHDTESEPFLWIDYEYYSNGNLKSRFYWHSGYVFGSSYSTWQCYFDEQGRIAYEDIYITHGSEDTYYIYMDDTKEPAYILDLDNNMGWWMPEFLKIK